MAALNERPPISFFALRYEEQPRMRWSRPVRGESGSHGLWCNDHSTADRSLRGCGARVLAGGWRVDESSLDLKGVVVANPARAAVLVGLLLTASLPCAVPAGAGAATVSVLEMDDGGGELRYQAGPAEPNAVNLRYDGSDGGRVTVTDTGAVIVPTGSCTAIDEHTVSCGWPDGGGGVAARADLGDLDDTLVAHANVPLNAVVAYGGPGDDRLQNDASGEGRLHGGPGDDQLVGGSELRGGPGDDKLFGGAGLDDLDGGGGTDELHGGGDRDDLRDGDRDDDAARPRGPDLLDGGDGNFDRVSYRRRMDPVRVDLSTVLAANGHSGEGDTLVGVEAIVGGHGDDRLFGSGARNRFHGGPGEDRLVGRGRNDKFWPGTGGDSIACGSGRRDIIYAGRHVDDYLERDCERLYPTVQDDADLPGSFIESDWTVNPYPTQQTGGSLSYSIDCPVLRYLDFEVDPDFPPHRFYEIRECSISVRLRTTGRRHRLLANVTLDNAGTFGLTALGWRLAQRRRGVRAAVSVLVEGDYHSPERDVQFATVIRWTIRLRI